MNEERNNTDTMTDDEWFATMIDPRSAEGKLSLLATVVTEQLDACVFCQREVCTAPAHDALKTALRRVGREYRTKERRT